MTKRHDPEQKEKGGTGRRALEIDWKRYEAYLAEADLSEAEKRQFLEALWSIVVAFVDLGFEVHPVQIACGQVAEGGSSAPLLMADVIDLESSSPTRPFEKDARRSDPAPQERRRS